MSNARWTLKALAGALAAALALVPGQAAGEGAKYDREQTTFTVKQTDRTKKLEAKADDPAAAGPSKEITAEQVLQAQAQIQGDIDEYINELKETIKDFKATDPRRADIVFRLGEAYSEKQKLYHSQSMEAAGRADRAKTEKDKNSALKTQADMEGKAKDAFIQAIKYYKAIADDPNNAGYPRMDEVLYALAYSLERANYGEESRNVYRRLIRDYQKSKYIPEAYRTFADFFFNEKRMADAEAFYDKILELNGPLYEYALYKKGWVYFNVTRFTDAMKIFVEVIERTRGKKSFESMYRAARRDFVRMYSEDGDVAKAFATFEKVDKESAFKMQEWLGEFYVDQGKWDKAIFTLRELMSRDPKNKELCNWQYTIVRASQGLKRDVLVKSIDDLGKLYTYLKGNPGTIPDDKVKECYENAQGVTGEQAKIWHLEGLKLKDDTLLGLTQALYGTYIQYYPDADDAVEMAFNSSELIWMRAEQEKNKQLASEKWGQTKDEFLKVVRLCKATPKKCAAENVEIKKDLLKEAAYAAMLAAKNQLNIEVATKVNPRKFNESDPVPKPKDIPAKEQSLLDAFDIYLSTVDDVKDKDRTDITFIKCRTYWTYLHIDEAIPYCEDILKNNPTHETGLYAANIVLDLFIMGKKYEKLVEWTDKLLDEKHKDYVEVRSKNPDLDARLKDIKLVSMDKYAKQLYETKQYKQCALTYIDIYEKYADKFNETDAAGVLFNGAQCYEEARLIGNAIKYRKLIIDRYAKTKWAKEAQFKLALNYGAIAMYNDAAEQFEKYAKDFGTEKDASQALSNATFYRKGIGDDELAIKDTTDFIKKYKDSLAKEAAAAAFSIISIHEKNQDRELLQKALYAYIRDWGERGGVDRLIIAETKLGEMIWQDSCPEKGLQGACIKVTRSRAMKSDQDKKKKKKSKKEELPTQCGPESKNKVYIFDRKPALVKEAQGHFKKAIAAWNNGKAVDKIPGKDEGEKMARTADAMQWTAAANFYLAEQKYETFLTIKFPAGLDFNPERPKRVEESTKKFKAYLEEKTKGVQTAKGCKPNEQGCKESDMVGVYMPIVEGAMGLASPRAPWAIASAARVGQIYQNFADQLLTAPIPEFLRQGEFAEDMIAAFCDQLTEAADPLEQKAVEALSYCLDTSTKLNWFNDWSRLCEGELAQIRPQDYPAAGEIRGKSDKSPEVLDLGGIVTDLDPKAAAAAVTPAPASEPAKTEGNK